MGSGYRSEALTYTLIMMDIEQLQRQLEGKTLESRDKIKKYRSFPESQLLSLQQQIETVVQWRWRLGLNQIC